MPPASPKPFLEAFLEQYWKDREAGTVRDLSDYLNQFPGASDAIAAEFLSLQRGAVPEPDDGSRLGPNRLKDEIGRGGQAVVSLAEDTPPTRQVALKALRGLFSGHEDLAGRPHDEVLEEGSAGAEHDECQGHRRDRNRERTPAHGLDDDRLGPYRILEELGRGGQGVVYKAEDTRLRRKVALKVLTALGPGSEELVRRFRREAEIASRLEHPGICGVYDAGVADGIPYIAMQFVPGETLAQRLKASRRSPQAAQPSSVILVSETADPAVSDSGEEEAHSASPPTTNTVAKREIPDILSVFEKTARALHAAHEAGVIHRDIKPANIMLGPSGEPVILDFGLARSEDPDQQTLTHTGDLFGTPAYMSPEQLMGNRIRLDRRSDVYSLGATLYECLTLRRPFEGQTREALYQNIMTRDASDPRELNPAISRDLRTVIEKTLEKDRDHRYETALEFAEELRRVREYEPIRAKPVARWVHVKRWAQRNPGVAISLGLFILGLLAGIVVAVVLLARVTDERDRADTHLKAWQRMSDMRLILELEREAEEELWPAWPDKVEGMDRWIASAQHLVSRRPLHEGTLENLRAEALAYNVEDQTRDRTTHPRLAELAARRAHATTPPHDAPTSELALLEAEVAARRTWRFPDLEQEYRHKVFSDLCSSLSRLSAEGGLLADVEKRRAFAGTVFRRSIEEHRSGWEAARERVGRDPRFAGFQFRPQTGLVPLGPDSVSRLEEFWLLEQTGKKPERDAQGGLAITEETGLVLVLLPGSTFRMGAPKVAGQEVHLSPFFLSKYEMTQGQWQRLVGSNPSWWQPQRTDGIEITLRNPVEQISWEDCQRFLPRAGLRLPTDAQWEYGCRAGTQTVWWCGDDVASIQVQRAGNIADATAARQKPWQCTVAVDDGYIAHAPVGVFAPNGFGLHDVLGNVWEWCRDGFGDDSSPTAGPDGERYLPGARERVSRGGGFAHEARAARSGNRIRGTPGERMYGLGCRPSWAHQ